MRKLIALLTVLPALLLSGCSSAPAEPASPTLLTWDQVSETPEYKNWLDTVNCYTGGDVDTILNLEFLPIKESDSSRPTIREIMATRTTRLKASLASEASMLKMLGEASSWGAPGSDEELKRIWINPSEIKALIDSWVTDRFNLASEELGTNSFSTRFRDNMKKDWESKCDDETLLAEVSTTLEEYEVSLDALSTKLVANFEKKGYKNYFNNILVKRIGPKVFEGEKVLAFSVFQHRYCDTGYTGRVYGFDFSAPGVKADADGIIASDLRSYAQETTMDGPDLGLREFVYETWLDIKVDLKKYDLEKMVVTGTRCL